MNTQLPLPKGFALQGLVSFDKDGVAELMDVCDTQSRYWSTEYAQIKQCTTQRNGYVYLYIYVYTYKYIYINQAERERETETEACTHHESKVQDWLLATSQ